MYQMELVSLRLKKLKKKLHVREVERFRNFHLKNQPMLSYLEQECTISIIHWSIEMLSESGLRTLSFS
jgi:hypothetical protein